MVLRHDITKTVDQWLFPFHTSSIVKLFVGSDDWKTQWLVIDDNDGMSIILQCTVLYEAKCSICRSGRKIFWSVCSTLQFLAKSTIQWIHWPHMSLIRRRGIGTAYLTWSNKTKQLSFQRHSYLSDFHVPTSFFFLPNSSPFFYQPYFPCRLLPAEDLHKR